MDILSFLIWSVGSIWSALDKLMNSISDRLSTAEISEANDLLDYLSVSDTALKHGLGETAYSYTNMVLKKRSQILSFCSRDVSKVHRAALLYSPVDGPKLFPDEVVRQTAVSVGETSKHDFFVDAAKRALAPKKFFVAPPTVSPLVDPGIRGMKKNFRGKQKKRGRGRGGFKKPYFPSSKPGSSQGSAQGSGQGPKSSQ